MPKFRNGLSRVGKVYHYCFRINGKQFKGSTRAEDRVTAEQILALKRREALLGPQTKQVPIPKLKELVDSWVGSNKSTFSTRHIEIVQSCAKVWILPAMGNLTVDRINSQLVVDLRNRMLEKGRSPATANLLLRVLNLLMSCAVRMGHIKEPPFKLAPLRIQRKPRPTVPAARFQEFLSTVDAVTPDARKRAALRVMVGLGLRSSEVTGMRWEWLDADRGVYVVGKSKGKEARALPVPGWVWNALGTLPGRLSPWVFCNEQGDPYNRNFLRNTLKQVAKRMGLGNLTLHRLRSTFGTLHHQAGTPVVEIKELLGHKSLSTTLIYLETSLEGKRKAQDHLSKVLGFA